MSEANGNSYVRGAGSLAEGRGEIAWRLGGADGAVALSGGEVSVIQSSGLDEGSSKGWSYRAAWDDDPLESAGVFRHVAIEAPDRGSLLVSSRGEPGIEGHGLERTEGVLQTADGSTRFEESLISTQYDGAGDPSRIGLELWPEEADQANRAAATRVSGSLLGGVRSGAVWAGFFRCHTGGTEGLGCYLLWRP